MLVKCGSEIVFISGRAHGRTQTLFCFQCLMSVLTAHNQSNILVAPPHFTSGKGL